MFLRAPRRRRLAGVERYSRVSQGCLNRHRQRVRAAKHASRERCQILEYRHGLADVIQCGTLASVKRLAVICPQPERSAMTLSDALGATQDIVMPRGRDDA